MAFAAEPHLQIDEVTYPPQRHARLGDRHLEEPSPGGVADDAYALRIRGWVTGTHSRVVGAEVVHRGLALADAPVSAVPVGQQSPIRLSVSTLGLPHRFRLTVRAVLEDETRSPVARIAGTRAPLRASPGPGPAPVLLTMIGRSGSTALSNLLCHHPDVAGYKTWDTETRIVSYWTSVLLSLARPQSYERQLHAGAVMTDGWWIGGQPPYPQPPEDAEALSAIGRSAIDALASFCNAQIGRVTGALAAAGGKPDARFFVEKAAPAMLRSTAEVMEELDPRAREVLLIRDPRDMVCSMRAYSDKRGSFLFGPGPDASIEDTIRWLSHNGAAGLVDYMQRRGRRVHVVRYEDLVGDQRETLVGVLEHIGASTDPETVTEMLARLAAQRSQRAGHATTDSTDRSVGRWRSELTPVQQELAQALFRPHLEALGYD